MWQGLSYISRLIHDILKRESFYDTNHKGFPVYPESKPYILVLVKLVRTRSRVTKTRRIYELSNIKLFVIPPTSRWLHKWYLGVIRRTIREINKQIKQRNTPLFWTQFSDFFISHRFVRVKFLPWSFPIIIATWQILLWWKKNNHCREIGIKKFVLFIDILNLCTEALSFVYIVV